MNYSNGLRFIKKGILLGLVGVLAGCANPASSSSVSHVSIQSVDWVIENIDKDFWTTPESDSRLYYDFWITYQGTLNLSDIRQVRMELPDRSGSYWTLYPSQGSSPAEFVQSASSYVGGYGRWYLTDYLGTLPLGTLTAVIEYNDGTLVKKTWTSHEPGSLAVPTHAYVTNEDSDETPDGSTSVKALKRPTVTAASRTSNSVTLNLTLADDRTCNGYLYFYDDDGAYLGRSTPFRDPASGVLSSAFGSATSLQTSGSNALTLGTGLLVDADGTTPGTFLSRVATVVARITDGAQYVTVDSSYPYGHYDYSGVGAQVSVSSN